MEAKIYLFSFLVGGLICMAAQLVLDLTRFTPGHVLAGLTVLGGILGGFGIYDSLVDFAGAGATMPISSFGNTLVKGAISEAQKHGVIGVLTGMFELTSTGITAAIVFGFLTAIIFHPKG
ncbi:MAG: stage sporulation protein [Thermosediminibacterales bacterium]|nr:stage sporulation protein [Thermosediminibacterales bacterium]MDK2835226.1 stage sporulation protein [Thermosediminibacterales bacterium]